MPFDASDESLVPELSFKFHPIYERDNERFAVLKDANGFTPEPSDDDIERFQTAMTAAMAHAIPEGVDPSDRAAVAAATRNMPDGTFRKVQDAVTDAVAELTKGSPSREQIAALPFRYKRLYIQSLQNDLMAGEGEAAAMSS